MIVKLIRPVPLVDRVASAGEFLDGDKLLERLVRERRAVFVQAPEGPEKPEAVKPRGRKNVPDV